MAGKNRASTSCFTARKPIRLESSLLAKVACAAVLLFSGAAASALGAEPTTPTPAPTASPAADPCGAILSIVSRPSITTAVCTVRPHHFEIESGWNNTVTTGNGAGNLGSYGIGAVRFGTGDPHFEFLLEPPTRFASSGGGPTANGWGDSGFGLRKELGYTSNWLWGVNALATVPTGDRAYSAGGMQFTGNFNWAYTVNPVIGLAGTLGFNQLRAYDVTGTSRSYFAFIPTLEATAALPGPSQLFAEYAYYSQTGIGIGNKGLLDVGYLHDLGPHVVFDIEYGDFTTVAGAHQHYVGAGLTFMN